MTVTIHVGDALEVLRGMPDESVHCCVTSPPYWGLRSYGGDPGMIGLEPTLDEHIANLVAVFREVRRVLRGDGTCWVNYGDRMSVGTNFFDEMERLLKGSLIVRRRRPTIRVTRKGAEITGRNNRFPDSELRGLLGVERVVFKQRHNNFRQIIHLLGSPSDCRIDVPPTWCSVNAADLEVVLDSSDGASIIVTERDADVHAKFPVFPAWSSEKANGPFAIEKPSKPVPEIIADGESVGNAVSLDSLSESSLNVYLVNEAIPLGYGFLPLTSDFRNLLVAKASEQQLSLALGNGGVNLAFDAVSHDAFLSRCGSFVRYDELYKTATENANTNRAKQLMGMPDRVRSALQRDGWICRSEVIWHKPNPMPESVTDRPTSAHEKVFLLSKSARYFYDAEAVREEGQSGPSDLRKMVEGKERIGGKHKHLEDPFSKASAATNIGRQRSVGSPGYRSLRNVWAIATCPFPGAHFATFPPALVEPCIKAGTSAKGVCGACGGPWRREVEATYSQREDMTYVRQYGGNDELDESSGWRGYPDLRKSTETTGWSPTCDCAADIVPATCLDPFAGAGTVGLVAQRLGRGAVLIEINADYARMAEQRIVDDAPLLADVSVG